eukprot:g14686.t1
MGCQSSKQATLVGENRPQELAKCAALSGDVRWAWLRSRSLFTFAEIRALWLVFVKCASSETRLEQLGTSAPKAPICSVESKWKGSSPAQPARTVLMDKAQFLSFCDSSDNFGVSEVVGIFGSRLFDVLDDDGDGYLNFETFALGLSKLLKGPESEKLKLMYAAYDLSGVAPSEERRKSSENSANGSGSTRTLSGIGGGGSAIKAKQPRRSKYLSLEDITTVLASASQVTVYPTLLSFTTEGGPITTSYLSGGGTGDGGSNGCSCGSGGIGESKSASASASASDESPRDAAGGIRSSSWHDSMSSGSICVGVGGRRGRGHSGGGEGGGYDGGGGSSGSSSARTSRDPEALAQLMKEIARRNAAEYAARAVSEFGQAHSGALTQKEFEKWALTGPVLRCRINEFSIDLDLAPFQGVRLA